MPNIVSDKPYQFTPAKEGRLWPTIVNHLLLDRYLRREHGVVEVTFKGVGHLHASLAAGHGIVIAPNHCRTPDPMVLCSLARLCRQPFFIMASSHLFRAKGLASWLLPRVGVFSVYREGADRESLKFAIDALTQASRPLVLFPEGLISRTNDRLGPLQEGVSFIARNAAKQREAKDGGKVVVHPVALRYRFRGDLPAILDKTLSELETRLTWRPMRELTLAQRVSNIGDALLGLKELEHTGTMRTGPFKPRIHDLIEAILSPLEAEWLRTAPESGVTRRVKALRGAILPGMVANAVDDAERARRWRQLDAIALAQQLALYPENYIAPDQPPHRLLEIVEGLEEDLTDRISVHGPLSVEVTVGEAIPVSSTRVRGAQEDPLLSSIRNALETLLDLPQAPAAPGQ